MAVTEAMVALSRRKSSLAARVEPNTAMTSSPYLELPASGSDRWEGQRKNEDNVCKLSRTRKDDAALIIYQ